MHNNPVVPVPVPDQGSAPASASALPRASPPAMPMAPTATTSDEPVQTTPPFSRTQARARAQTTLPGTGDTASPSLSSHPNPQSSQTRIHHHPTSPSLKSSSSSLASSFFSSANTNTNTNTNINTNFNVYTNNSTNSRSSVQPNLIKDSNRRMHGLGSLIRKRLPILTWLISNPGYSWRDDLAEDLFAGATISAVVIPQSMAYAMLASLPPVYGLYTSLVPTIMYAILGTSKHMSTGAFAITSLLLGQFAHKILSDQGYSESSASDEYRRRYIPLCLVLTFLVGCIQIFLSMVRLGRWASRHLLPAALVSGFNTASAFHIGTHQLKHWLGVKPPRESGIFSMFRTWAWLTEHFWSETSWPTLAMGLAGILLMYILQRLEYRRRSNAADIDVISPSFTSALSSTAISSTWTPATHDDRLISPPVTPTFLQHHPKSQPHSRSTSQTCVIHLRDAPIPSNVPQQQQQQQQLQIQRRNSLVQTAVSDQALLTVQDVMFGDYDDDQDCDSCGSSYSPYEGSLHNDAHASLSSLALPTSTNSSSRALISPSFQAPRQSRRGGPVSNSKYHPSTTGLTNTGAIGHQQPTSPHPSQGKRSSSSSSQRAHRYSSFRSPTLTQARYLGAYDSDSLDEQEPLLHHPYQQHQQQQKQPLQKSQSHPRQKLPKRFGHSAHSSRRASVSTLHNHSGDDCGGTGGYCSTASNRSNRNSDRRTQYEGNRPLCEQNQGLPAPDTRTRWWIPSMVSIPKMHIPIPDIFICVVLFTLATVLFELDTKYGIEVIGTIPTGLPTAAWPPQLVSTWTKQELTPLIWPSILMAIVVYVMSLSVAKHFGRAFGYEVDPDQEMLAIGVGSLVGSCFGGYVCTGNLTRSAILAQLNVKTPLASLVGAVVVLMTLLWFTFLFEQVPTTILAAIVLVALKSLMSHTFEARKLWRVGRRKEALIWWVTFISVIVFSIEIGLAVGMVIVVLLKLYKNGAQWKKRISRSIMQSVLYQRLMLMLGLQSPLFTTGSGLNTGDDDDN
ncbi:hypothetical protein BGZ94_004144 [Podila epigama]|nr:hypothetical protein BGZ94_004144 [Podila epigama]